MRKTLFIVVVTICCGACSGLDGPALPGSPSPTTSYLVGVWVGTATITPYGQPTWSGGMTWTITEIPASSQRSYTLDLRSTNAWLPVRATTSLSLDPAPVPPAQISAAGSYTSPRSCVGIFLTAGPATATTIDADFSGSDCRDEAGNLTTFSGRVQLTKQ